jgi:ribosome-binding protein aMBF1 (putative translation factor)
MKESKRRKLEKKGWAVGAARDFLGLSDEEAALIELKLDLARSVRALRVKTRLSQQTLAKRIRSSQSRVAKMEAGDRSVSIELLLKGLMAMGATRKQLGMMVGRSGRR